MTTDYAKGLYKEYERLLTENEEIKKQNRVLKTTETLLQKEIARRQKKEGGRSSAAIYGSFTKKMPASSCASLG